MGQDDRGDGWDFRSPSFNPFNPAHYYDDGERQLEKLESAWAKAALYFRTGEHFGHPIGSRRMQGLIRIHEGIEVFRRRFEGGNTLALLQAVAMCAEENLSLPGWLAAAYLAALQGFLGPGGHPSLDAVFYSQSLPTGTAKKAATARQDWLLGTELWSSAWDMAMADESMQSLDAVVVKVLLRREFGVKKTKARALILMVENNQRELLGDPQSKHLSRFLEKRRKR